MKLKKNHFIILLSLFLTLFVSLYIYIVFGYYKCYDILKNELEPRTYLSTNIYDINGELISEFFEENRNYVDINEIPVYIKHAFIATEDHKFYIHDGIDPEGIIRAMINNVFRGKVTQGGSTITQQLVKQVYTKGERTLKRKIFEVFLTKEFEKKFSKDKILEMYMNKIYFGHGAYGISAAAKFYFSRDIKDLNVVEAALLAALPSAPNRFSPIKNPRIAFKKHKQVIYNMIDLGFIEKDEVNKSFNKFWKNLLDDSRTRFPTLGIRNKRFDKAPYFTEYIRRILVKKYGEKKVYQDGLKVYTTLDLRQQKIAQDVMDAGIKHQNGISNNYNKYKLRYIDRILEWKSMKKKKISRREAKLQGSFLRDYRKNLIDNVLLTSMIFGIEGIKSRNEDYLEGYENIRLSSRVEGSFIALDPRNGAITAMIGGSDFNSSNQLNRAVQSRRQPGSAFKAFVYGAGIESKKITAATAFIDAPILFVNRSKKWSPKNYDKKFNGKVLVRKALAASLNIVSVLIIDDVGDREVAKFASKLTGRRLSTFEIDNSLALGTTEFSPLEMTKGFAVYANNGREVNPYSIRYIINRNNEKIFNDDRTGMVIGKKIVSPQTAFILTSLLRGVVDCGTASSSVRRKAGFRLQAAGKTGTNTKYRDAWFIGYTPNLVATVWLGCDSQIFSLGWGQSASLVAAPIWGNFMREVYKFRKPSRFRGPPNGVYRARICSFSGKTPASGCNVKSEYFIIGTDPKGKCDEDHQKMRSIFDLVKEREK